MESGTVNLTLLSHSSVHNRTRGEVVQGVTTKAQFLNLSAVYYFNLRLSKVQPIDTIMYADDTKSWRLFYTVLDNIMAQDTVDHNRIIYELV